MYILMNQYDVGRKYHVVNPDDWSLSSGDGALMCDKIAESPLGDACVCVLSVVVSRAKNLPRNWKHVQPGIQDTEVQWNKKHRVFVQIFNNDDDDDDWLY